MKVDVLVPTSLSEITLKQFTDIVSIEEKNGTNEFLMQKVVEIICGIDLKSVALIAYKDVKEIFDHVQELLNKKADFKNKFSLYGKKYGFIPLLDEMSFGEYIDINENFKSWETIHKAMAVLYRPIVTEKNDLYSIEDYDGIKNSNVYLDMPIDVVLGAQFFFLNLGMELMQITLNFSIQDKDLSLEEKQVLLKSGDGFKASLDSLREILQKSKILPN